MKHSQKYCYIDLFSELSINRREKTRCAAVEYLLLIIIILNHFQVLVQQYTRRIVEDKTIVLVSLQMSPINLNCAHNKHQSKSITKLLRRIKKHLLMAKHLGDCKCRVQTSVLNNTTTVTSTAHTPLHCHTWERNKKLPENQQNRLNYQQLNEWVV